MMSLAGDQVDVIALLPRWLAPRPSNDNRDGGRSRVEHSGRTTSDDGHGHASELSQDDATIAAAIRAGNEGAFDALFRAYHGRLVTFATVIAGSADAADDVVADVFRRIWTRRDVWTPAGTLERYLFLAVRNQARTVVRDARRRTLWLDSSVDEVPGRAAEPASLDDTMQQDDLRVRVWALIDAMPEPRRVAAHLRWHEGMAYPDIAQILGTSSAAVQMQLSRALQTLRALLGE